MRLVSARPFLLLALLYAGTTVAVTGPPAAAVTESHELVVSSQYGGSTCPNNQKVIIADAFTGNIVPNGVLGTPNTQFGNINEAKPFDDNSKIVALWGGANTTTQRAGVGVFDRVSHTWLAAKTFSLPADFEVGAESAHSITVLPDGNYAVAQTGSIGVTGNGFVVVFSSTGAKLNQYPLTSAHGVEYDTRTGFVYAVGATHVVKYSYSVTTAALTQLASYALPTTGGHDLRRRRQDNRYSVSTNGGTHVWDPNTGAFTGDITMNDGVTRITGAKSVDQRFDGLVEFNWWDENSADVDTFNYLDGRQIGANFCTNVYKAGRWLYDVGTQDYDDGTGGTSTPTWSPTFTVGGGANSWWIEIYASSDVVSLDVIGKNGQFFMSNLPKHSWGGFGQSPPQEMTAGSLIKLIGRKADGSSAGSITFPWLQDPNPDTEAGWNAAFTIHQCNAKLEATISSAAVAAKVRIGTADWAAMTKNATTGRWERSPGVPVGTKYLIRAYLAPGTESAPQAYDLIRVC